MTEELTPYTNVLAVPEAVTATDIAFQAWHNFANECGDAIVPMFTQGHFQVTVTVLPILEPEE